VEDSPRPIIVMMARMIILTAWKWTGLKPMEVAEVPQPCTQCQELVTVLAIIGGAAPRTISMENRPSI